MSIAVSVVVRPSKMLLALRLCLSAGVLGIGVAIGMGLIGENALSLRLWMAVACLSLAIYAAVCAVRDKKSRLIDISGNGQIRLADTVVGAQPSTTGSMLVELMADSTLWSNLLLLRLQTEDHQIINLLILPDRVDRDSLRALSVACRWIASHPRGIGGSRLPEESSDP